MENSVDGVKPAASLTMSEQGSGAMKNLLEAMATI